MIHSTSAEKPKTKRLIPGLQRRVTSDAAPSCPSQGPASRVDGRFDAESVPALLQAPPECRQPGQRSPGSARTTGQAALAVRLSTTSGLVCAI